MSRTSSYGNVCRVGDLFVCECVCVHCRAGDRVQQNAQPRPDINIVVTYHPTSIPQFVFHFLFLRTHFVPTFLFFLGQHSTKEVHQSSPLLTQVPAAAGAATHAASTNLLPQRAALRSCRTGTVPKSGLEASRTAVDRRNKRYPFDQDTSNRPTVLVLARNESTAGTVESTATVQKAMHRGQMRLASLESGRRSAKASCRRKYCGR
jgi:hypothetical protein